MGIGTARRFSCHHAFYKKRLKGEDFAFVVENLVLGETKWSLYCVCDGHGGDSAARFVREKLPALMKRQLPTERQPSNLQSKEGRCWAKKVAEALASAFCSLDQAFAQALSPSGTTITLAAICGSLVTVANVGDSEAYLDILHDILPMTDCHKAESNAEEQARLQNNNVTLSPLLSNKGRRTLSSFSAVGPVRVWPGGIAISRSLGDFDSSPHVIANPHITQALIPGTGARLILATDGLWDHMSGRKACRVVRRCLLSRAPCRLFRSLMTTTCNSVVDDTTIVVVDILPAKGTNADFSLLCRNAGTKIPNSNNLWDKVKKAVGKFPGMRRAAPGIYARMDSAKAFPSISSNGHSIYRKATSCTTSSFRPKQTSRKRFTLCNAETNRWHPDESNELFLQMQSRHILSRSV